MGFAIVRIRARAFNPSSRASDLGIGLDRLGGLRFAAPFGRGLAVDEPSEQKSDDFRAGQHVKLRECAPQALTGRRES
jgi:hypothetical protein